MSKRATSGPVVRRNFLDRVRKFDFYLSQSVASHGQRSRTFEQLENRHMMTATPLQPVGPQLDATTAITSSVSYVQAIQTLAQQALAGTLGPDSPFAVVSAEEFDTYVFTEEKPFVVAPDGRISFSTSTTSGLQAALAAELAAYNTERGDVEMKVYAATPYDDPLFAKQWHLLNTGQLAGQPDYQYIRGIPGVDVNVMPVWERGYTGEGVVVAVVDSGVELLHPDLKDNFVSGLQFDAIDGGNNPNPDFTNFINAHGTAVAGIIGAGDNEIGGIGIAPNVGLSGIRIIDTGQTVDGFIDMFRFETDTIDVYNHSWGPAAPRTAAGPTAGEVLALRDGFYFGRDGLGSVHVFASGNGGSAAINGGPYGYAAYNGYVNSRYTIGVTGYDHDGLYANIDGTVTSYPESGPSVLVAAPTGSVYLQVSLETQTGSGIVTTDLRGDYGFNAGADPVNGAEDPLGDYLEDTDYATRFNGTSAAAPMVSGVIALMLEANPNLTFRDIEEILVRSAEQIAQFEIPATGGGLDGVNTWIVNQDKFFFDPDDFGLYDNFPSQYTPEVSIDQPAEPFMWTNGAGYTVSQGRGAYGEALGYGHGGIDADLAVRMAEQWHNLEQELAPELTFTTFLFGGLTAIPGEVGNADTGNLVIPGGIGGIPGFADYWDEYYEDEPFVDDPPANTRGSNSVSFTVPDTAAMSIEWVEIRGDLGGLWDNVRVSLVSPTGVHSDFNHYFRGLGNSFQPEPFPVGINDPGGDALGAAGNWVFSTNRNWGERSDSAVIFDPITGDPYDDMGQVLTRDWEIRIENYSNAPVSIGSFEIVWHGTPIAPNTQRIQGFVGIDENQDELFNFERFQQVINDVDPATLRHSEIVRTVDLTQEDFAENVVVSVRRASDNFVVDRFLTGHDGNFYFDLVPDTYIVSVEAPTGYDAIDDPNAPADRLAKYKTEWVITPDWFNVWDRDRLNADSYDPVNDYDVPIDALTGAPVAYQAGGASVAYHVQGINFLLNPVEVPPPVVEFSGTVYTDANGNGVFDGQDTVRPSTRVFLDVNLNDAYDSADIWTVTDANGGYTITVNNVTATALYQLGVDGPNGWTPSNPIGGLTDEMIVEVGDTVTDLNFFLAPPGVEVGEDGDGDGVPDPPPGGDPPPPVGTGHIAGNVFFDADGDAVRDAAENGIDGFLVYLDSNFNGSYDSGENATFSVFSGEFAFSALPVGTYVVRVRDEAGFVQTQPAAGSGRVVNLHSGDNVTNLSYGVQGQLTANVGVISGAVFLDDNGNGTRQNGENGIPGFNVYIDINGDDVYLAGTDIPAVVNASGGFSFNQAPAGINVIRIAPLSGYTQSAPAGGEFIVNLQAGQTISNLEFGVESQVVGQNGNVTGSVYLDANGNSQLDGTEAGIVGFTVFIDANNDSTYNAADGDILATAGANGTFAFTGAPAGVHVVRVQQAAGYVQTDPITGGGRVINLQPGQTMTGVNFGVMAQGVTDFDYGDLPFAPSRLVDTGPRHLVVAGHSLGLLVDRDPDGQPNSTATGDDAIGDDEDGVTLTSGGGTLMPNETATFVAVVNGIGMHLNAWMDLNGDGTFNNEEEWIVRDSDVNPGAHTYNYAVPGNLNISGPVAMRWRLGTDTTKGHDFRGDDIIGEVEDYLVPINPNAQPATDPLQGDYDGSGFVDQNDRAVWSASFGTNNSAADGNGDGIVDLADYTIWRDNLGAGASSGGSLLLGGEEAGTGYALAVHAGFRVLPPRVLPSAAYVFSAPTSSGASLVASSPAAWFDGGSISLIGSTFEGTLVGSNLVTEDEAPAAVAASVDVVFEQLADEEDLDDSTGFAVESEEDEPAEDAYAVAFAGAF